ncbi:hypothetical protein [Nocardioides sp.]|nr:hypothetical protein [Nocardioides sp.]MCW2738326.1 hypothetical protein [Nocardioides sp.]
MGGVTIINISSPFWAVPGGVLISLAVKSKDFTTAASSPAS